MITFEQTSIAGAALITNIVVTLYITSRAKRARKGDAYEIEKISGKVADEKISSLKEVYDIIIRNIREDNAAFINSIDRQLIGFRVTQTEDHDDIVRLISSKEHTDQAIAELKTEIKEVKNELIEVHKDVRLILSRIPAQESHAP